MAQSKPAGLMTLYEAAKASGVGYQTLALAVKAKPPKVVLKVASWVQVGPKQRMPMVSMADIETYKRERANTRSTRIGPKTVEKYADYFGLDKATGMELRRRKVAGRTNKVDIRE